MGYPGQKQYMISRLFEKISAGLHMPGRKGEVKLHLNTLLIALFLLQATIISALVGYAFYRNGRLIIDEVSYRLHSETNARIGGFLKSFTDSLQKIVENNLAIIRSGIIKHNDKDTIERYFIKQLTIHRSVNSFYFGNTAGGVVNARRDDRIGQIQVSETENFTVGRLITYITDKAGNRTKSIETMPGYDSRNRPWYKNAVKSGDTVWNPPYVLFSGKDIAASVSSPVYDSSGRLLGVVSAVMFLEQISSFLAGLSHEKSGVSYIVDRYGLLIALSGGSSVLSPITGNAHRRRVHASESYNSLVRGSFERLKERTGGGLMMHNDIHFMYHSEGKSYIMHASPFSSRTGIDWIIITVNPESDFADAAKAGNMVMLVMIFMAVIVCAAIGYFTSRWIAVPILSLSADIMCLGSGKWPERGLNNRIIEINDLEESFNGISIHLKCLIESMQVEVKERKLTEQALRESEEKYRALIEHSSAIIVRLDTAGRITYANDYALEFFGFRINELIGRKAVGTVIPYIDSSGNDLEEMMNELLKNPENYHRNENENIRKDGSRVMILWSNREIFNNDGNYAGITSIGTDITDRAIAEKNVQKLLAEKELILREVHHRVKNNMNTIAGILYLQSETVRDETASSALMEAHNRVLNMMLIYERLFRSSEFSGMQARDFFPDLISGICSTFSGFDNVSIITEIDECTLNSSQLIPIGIIINELMTNTYKYAFPGGRGGTIKISFNQQGSDFYSLVFTDDGIGMPENFIPGQSKGFGLNLVYLLAGQLGGSVIFNSSGGSSFTINFSV